MMELTIKTLDSQTRSFSVKDDITVRAFKEKIARDVEIEASSQRLIYQGRVLQDDKKLAEYEVNGKVVHLVQRPPPHARTTTTRPSTTGTTTTTSSSSTRSSRESIVVGAFTLPADVTDSNEVQRIVQQVISGMGDIGRNARVTSRQSADGSSVDVHINLGQLAVPQLHSESQLRVDHVRNMIRQAYETIDRLENPPGGGVSSRLVFNDDRMDTSSSRGGASGGTSTTSGGTTGSSTSTTSSSSSSGTGTPSLTEILSRLWNPDHPNMPVMADLIDEVMRLQRRLQPHLDRFQRYLREDPDFSRDDEGVRMAQRHCNLVTEVLHFISHSYHAISDCMVDMTRPPPRVLRAPPTPVLPSLSPNPLQANINLTTVQSNSGSRMSTGTTTSESTSTTTSAPGTSRPSSTTTTSTATPPPPPSATAAASAHSAATSAASAHSAASSAASLAGILGMGPPIMMSISRTTAIPIAIHPGGRATVVTTTSTTSSGNTATGTTTTGTTGGSSTTTTATTTSGAQPAAGGVNTTSLQGSLNELAQMIPVLQNLVHSMQGTGVRPGDAATSAEAGQTTTSSGSSTSTTSTTSSTATSASATLPGMFATGGRTVPVANFFGLNAHRDQFLPCASRHFFLRRPTTQSETTTTSSTTTTRSPITTASSTSTTRTSSSNSSAEPQGEEQLADMIGNLVGSLINQHNPYLQPHPPPGTGDVSSDDDSMDGTAANNNNANSANPPPEPANPVLASLLRGIRNLVGNPNSEDNPFAELFTSESNPRSQRADEVFMTIGRGIDEHLDLARRGEDIPSAHNYMVSHGLQYHTMLGQGLLASLIQFLARNLNFNDISNILLGQNEPLRNAEFRTKCQDFIKTTVLEGKEANQENIKNGADKFARNIVEVIIVNPSNFPTKDDIDLVETNVEFFRSALIKLIDMVLNSTETGVAYAEALQALLIRSTHEWLVLNIRILQRGQSGVEEIIKQRVSTLTRDMNPLFRSWLTTIGPQNIRTVAENFQVTPQEVQCYIKKTGAASAAETAPSEPMTNGAEPISPSRDKPTSPVEKMETDAPASQDQPVSHKKRASPDQTEFNDGAAGASPVTMESQDTDGWQSAIPADWVPVITNDISRQRHQGPQAPLSDAYLSGMPPKRRRLMAQRRPYGGVDTVLPNVLQRAVETASVQPITSAEELAADLRENTNLHSAYEQQIRSSIQRRLRQDPNYNRQKYPNTETYFNQDQQ